MLAVACLLFSVVLGTVFGLSGPPEGTVAPAGRGRGAALAVRSGEPETLGCGLLTSAVRRGN
ncbi:hypothetical protein GCM10009533_10250 [Saccharopolyspora spinosporotrichia]|uniref:Secreted protein n=1 Tax=Saccharopolyspora erythraea TaxID=1836 RepID=A0ABP3M7F9_SACER|nr:hypothetical protein N599_00610 [Saccharopolyspora erythraea D]